MNQAAMRRKPMMTSTSGIHSFLPSPFEAKSISFCALSQITKNHLMGNVPTQPPGLFLTVKSTDMVLLLLLLKTLRTPWGHQGLAQNRATLTKIVGVPYFGHIDQRLWAGVNTWQYKTWQGFEKRFGMKGFLGGSDIVFCQTHCTAFLDEFPKIQVSRLLVCERVIKVEISSRCI